MDYEAWEQTLPGAITGDPLWKMQSYRLALYVADVGWDDVSNLVRDRRTGALADQLYRALGSIGANIAEGYSRGTGRDQARFFEYALGSAREARHWYYNARHVLGEAVTSSRLNQLARITRLLLATVQQGRTHNIREAPALYEAAPEPDALTQHATRNTQLPQP